MTNFYDKLEEEFYNYERVESRCRNSCDTTDSIKIDFLFKKIAELQKEIFYLKSKEARFK